MQQVISFRYRASDRKRLVVLLPVLVAQLSHGYLAAMGFQDLDKAVNLRLKADIS